MKISLCLLAHNIARIIAWGNDVFTCATVLPAVGQLQTGGGSHVGHGGHVSLEVVGTEKGEEVENHS